LALFDVTVPTTIQCDAAAAVGTAGVAARRDHLHAIVCAAPAANLSVSTTNAEGNATSFARSNHSHAITSSSNPGAAASILATNASGYLQLVGLGIGVAAGAANRITIANGGTIGQAAGPLITFDDTNNNLEIMGCSVGIGTATPSDYYAANLVTYVGDEGGITIASSATTYAAFLMFADGTAGTARYSGYIGYDHNINLMRLGTNGTQQMTIDSGGNVTIGSPPTLSGYRLIVYDSKVGGVAAYVVNDGNDAGCDVLGLTGGADDGSGVTGYIVARDGNGDHVGGLRNNNGNFEVYDISDRVTKHNIRPTAWSGLEVVRQIQIYDYNRAKNPKGPRLTGTIAQEDQKLMIPGLVAEMRDGLLATSHSALIPFLVLAIQEQQEIIERMDVKLRQRGGMLA